MVSNTRLLLGRAPSHSVVVEGGLGDGGQTGLKGTGEKEGRVQRLST